MALFLAFCFLGDLALMRNNLFTFSSSMFPKRPQRLQEFSAKLGLITLPCFAVLGFSFFLLFASGELSSPTEIVQQQKEGFPSLVGIAYSDPVRHFKLELTLLRKPAVLAIGTSRVLQFRAHFFNNDRSFYNAGGIIARAHDFSDFLNHIPLGNEPEVILIGLDQNLFNSAHPHSTLDRVRSHHPPLLGWFKIYQSCWAVVYKDYFKHKFSIRQLIFKKTARRDIGFNAFANDEGYREDGSYRYGRFLKKPVDITDRFNPKLEMVVRGQGHFAYGDTVSADAQQALALFLKTCKERNIHVVGFLPPYAHPIYETLKRSGKHSYIFQLEPVLKRLFQQHGFDFYNFSDLATTGASEQEAIDGYHASEKAYLRLLILMSESSRTLQKYVDLNRLKNLLKTSASDFQVLKD